MYSILDDGSIKIFFRSLRNDTDIAEANSQIRGHRFLESKIINFSHIL